MDLKSSISAISKANWTVIGSVITTAILTALLFWIGFQSGPTMPDSTITILIGMLGLVIGWIVGILGSPFDPREEQQFSAYFKGVSLFVSGYVVSKLNTLFDFVVAKEYLMQKMFVVRVIFFLVCFFLSLSIVFIGRKYGSVRVMKYDSISIPRSNVILDIVDNQLSNANPPETKEVFDELISRGITEQDARRLIGYIVAHEISESLAEGKPYNYTRVAVALKKLPEQHEKR